VYCRGDEWPFNCFDDSSHAWSAGPDAPDVGDFVVGFLAQDSFGTVVVLLEIFTVGVLV
jgi:hypothetical protein